MIKIVRNEQGNCINFYGSSNPTYWNACLSGEVDSSDNTLVNVKNDIKTAESGTTQYEFFRIPFTEFKDEDNNIFANAQEVADYITLKGNVTVGRGVEYKGVWNPDTNTPDITTDVTSFVNGDFYNVITTGTHDLGQGLESFKNGDEVIFDGTEWQLKPYAGALIEYDSTSILLNNNASVYADGAAGLEEPNGAEDGWYFKNDEEGKKINWYFVGNENAGYQMNKSTLEGGYVRLKVLTAMGVDSPFFSLYTTPKGDGFDAFWFRSRYTYTGDFSAIAVNQEVIAYWGDDPSVSPELTRVQLTLDPTSTLLSGAVDISTDDIYTMALGTNSAATVDSLEFIAKELGYKNQQYLRSYLLEAKLENIVVPQNNNDLTGEVIDFKLDATSTSIMLDNGYTYGVNTIKAVDTGDGLITIKSIQGGLVHWIKLDHTNVTIDGDSVVGGLNDVINTLNELYTVGAFQSVVISDPYSTMIADVNGVTTTEASGAQGDAIETGTDEYGATTTGYNAAGYKTPETINQAGEYFTFDIRNEGIIGFGLIPSQADYDNGDYNGNSTYADPSTFCNGTNSGHYGYQFSHWFHPSPNGPWTNYGANTSYSQREGWSNVDFRFSTSPEGGKWLNGDLVKIKVGIDENNFIAISYFDESTSLFVPIARTTYPVPNGLEYHLGIKFGDTTVRLVGIPKIHELEDLAPTMYFRYIESPDNNYRYPLFATEEEANYFDLQNGGTGTSSTNVYPDEPTFTQWYEPTNGHIDNGTVAPTSAILFEGTPVNWTEITSLVNANLVPSTFSDNSITVNELSAVNIQLHPIGASYVTSIVDTDNSGLTIDVNGIHLNGTAPEVTGDYDANPSDTYNIEVVRTNAYGSSSGTLTLNVTNLTAPVTAINGFNHVSGTTPMIDSDTMDDGSVVHVNGTVADGERFVIEKAYVEANILPNLNATDDKYIIGLTNIPEDFSNLSLSDFDTAIVWEYESASSHTFKFYRDGVVQQNIVINSLTQAFYDYAIEVNGTSAWLIACNLNNIMNEASPTDGGTFSNTYEATSIEDNAPVEIHMAVLNTTGDISTDDIETITTPTPAPTNLTNWTKALDFSGSNEHAKQVSNSTTLTALRMYGSSVTVPPNADTSKTASDSNSKPWATTIVFKADLNSSTQHIWNQGEGATSGDDNIYLKVDAQGQLQFNWGRVNAGSLNQCRVASGIQSNTWYGVYIAHKGTRLSGGDATASNLADAFDIRLMSSGDSFATLGSNLSTSANWTSTGGRMDRSFTGDFTIGGRGANRSFHGKVASMVITTLRADFAMPTDAEIELMITDPKKWEDDYRDGELVRWVSSTSITTYNPSNYTYGYGNTQIWLMGDGTSDSYANGIRNEVYPSDQNYTKLQLNSMVSNDIENININGLT